MGSTKHMLFSAYGCGVVTPARLASAVALSTSSDTPSHFASSDAVTGSSGPDSCRRALEQAVRAAELRELEEPRVHHRACLCYTTDDHALAAARAAQIAVTGRSSREKSRHLLAACEKF